jgi:hypothetical protein
LRHRKYVLSAVVVCLLGGGIACSTDALLWPFGNYYYFKNGLTPGGVDLTALISGQSGTSTTTTGGTTTTTDANSTDGSTTGGSGSVTTPNVNATFADGTLNGWTVVSGNWLVTPAGYAQSTGPAVAGYNALVIGEDTWSDYEVNLDIRLEVGAEYAVGVRWLNEETWYHCSHTVSGIASITKYMTGQTTKHLANSVSTPLIPGDWYHWRIVVQGNSITFYVEGEQAVSVTDASSPIQTGRVALLVAAGSIVDFDNVRVTAIGG